MARTAFEPTKEQRLMVQVMAACGMPQPSICAQIVNPQTRAPIDAKTLRKNFSDELKQSRQVANAMVAQSLFKKATGTGPQSVTAAIFWLKTQAGWREQPGDADDPPPPVRIEVTVRDASIRADAEHAASAVSDA